MLKKTKKNVTKLMTAVIAAVVMISGVKMPVQAAEVIAQGQQNGYYAKISRLWYATYYMYEYPLTNSVCHSHGSAVQGVEITRARNISYSALQFNVAYFSTTVTSNAWAIDLALNARETSYPSLSDAMTFESHIVNNQYYYNGDHTYGIMIGSNAPSGFYNIFPVQEAMRCRWEKYTNASSPAPVETGEFLMPYGASYVCCAYSSSPYGSANSWTVYHSVLSD